MQEQLRGYRLRGETYEPISDNRSEPLQLRLQVEERLIGFYREDTGEKLLIPDELAQALRQEVLARQQAEEQAEQQRQRAEQAKLQVQQLKKRLRWCGAPASGRALGVNRLINVLCASMCARE